MYKNTLSDVSIDANMGLYPLAFAIVETENKDSWGFFLTCLEQMVGPFRKPFTFMTDRQKGLIEALADIAPEAMNRKCCRHIYANLRQSHAGLLVKKLFWTAARAYTQASFNQAMNRLRDVKPGAYQWLLDVGDSTLWARHAFNHDLKNEHVTNNISESFNHWISELRDKPILKFVDGLRAKIMHRIETRFQKARKWNGTLCHRIVKKLNKVKEEAVKCDILVGGSYEFQVNEGSHHYIVNLLSRMCHCGVWDITGIPCTHAAAAIAYKRRNIEDFVHLTYTKEKFLRCYNHKIHGIADPTFWPQMDDVEPAKILPPILKRQPGRPKKHRRREVGEEPRALPSKKRFHIKCSICGYLGHNKRSCTKGVPSMNNQRGASTFAIRSMNAAINPEDSQTISSSAPQLAKSTPHIATQSSQNIMD